MAPLEAPPSRRYTGEALERNLERIGPEPDSLAARVLAGGQRAIVHVWARIDRAPPSSVAHRVVLSAPRSGSRVVMPQRFATDRVRFGPDGRLWRGSIARNERWAAWGEEVLAVAGGVVVEAMDSMADNTPPEFVRGTANRLVLDIGGGHYAVYAHLQRGSVRARPGERVRRAPRPGNCAFPRARTHAVFGGTVPPARRCREGNRS